MTWRRLTDHDVGLRGEELENLLDAPQAAGKAAQAVARQLVLRAAHLVVDVDEDEARELDDGDGERAERHRADVEADEAQVGRQDGHARRAAAHGGLLLGEVPRADGARHDHNLTGEDKLDDPQHTCSNTQHTCSSTPQTCSKTPVARSGRPFIYYVRTNLRISDPPTLYAQIMTSL